MSLKYIAALLVLGMPSISGEGGSGMNNFAPDFGITNLKGAPDGSVSNCNPKTGVCADSSCTVFSFPNSAASECPWKDGTSKKCGDVYCAYVQPGCATKSTDKSKCYGYVACNAGDDADCYKKGALCLESGVSTNFKICGDGSTVEAGAPVVIGSFTETAEECAAKETYIPAGYANIDAVRDGYGRCSLDGALTITKKWGHSCSRINGCEFAECLDPLSANAKAELLTTCGIQL